MPGIGELIANFFCAKAPDGALNSAQSWLKMTDGNDVSQSWLEASSFFKSVVPQQQWEAGFVSRRAPLGSVVSRKIISTSLKKAKSGMPDGQYVTIKYHTEFSNKKKAEEFLELMLDDDGLWRVCGYFFK